MKNIIILCAILLLPGIANAVQEPRQGRADPRVKTFVYDPNQVYTITGYYGYQTLIQFAPYETVLTIPTGSTTAWQVVPVQDSSISIKPMESGAQTSMNMTVVTSKRIYHFELRTAQRASFIRNPQITFGAKFIYPEDERLAAERALSKKKAIVKPGSGPNDWNLLYTYAGTKDIAPTATMDDGMFTFFQWPEGQAIPAIFYVNNDLSESLVNWRREGNFVVVERLGRQFTIRQGGLVACVFNDGFSLNKRTLNMPRESKIKVTTSE